MITPPRRADCVVLGVILVVGATLRFWALGFGLPHDSVRPDEEILVGASLSIFGGRLNPHFFDWPSLFLYVTAAGYAVLFAVQRVLGAVATADDFMALAIADPAGVHLVARVLAASAGVATIAVLYAAAREVCSRRTALIAAALLSVAFLHVRDSHYGLTDIPATFVLLCSFWVVTRSLSTGVTLARLALAGALAGLAASTKYNAALVLAPALALIAQHAVHRRDMRWAIQAVVVLAASSAAGFLAGTPYALLDYQPFVGALSNVREHVRGAHGVDLGRGWTYHVVFTLRYGLGLPLLVMSLAGALWLAVERTWRAALLLSFPIAYYATAGQALTVFTRYMMPMVPFLCLTAAVFIDRVAEHLERRFSELAVPALAVAALLGIAAAPPLTQSIAFDRLLARADTRLLGAAWVESHFSSGAALYQTGASYGHVQPRPKERYAEYTFDDAAGRFELNGQLISGGPDVVVRSQSPLKAYSDEPAGLAHVLDTDYVQAMTIVGLSPAQTAPASPIAEGVYDQQDAWYLPYAGFAGIRRPGPNLLIFVRRK